MSGIKVVQAALAEGPDDTIILRGEIDPHSFGELKVAEYQREVQPRARISKLIEAFQTGSVPDIELGMRGHRVLERGGAFFLQDPVYIVDGLQRVTAARQMVQQGGELLPRLGAAIHFGTTERWERERFDILNVERLKLSPNVLMRNMRHDSEAIKLLYTLCRDKSFVMHGRVQWGQNKRRHELISALTLLRTVGALHGHAGPGRSTQLKELAPGVDKIMETVGPNVFRDNVRMFFEIVDQCWGIKRVVYREGAAYMHSSFLVVLATVFSRHTNFWRGERLFVEAQLVRKLALFPVSDPHVVNLSSSGGKARDLLLALLVDHINSGKRTRRLKTRRDLQPVELSEEPEPENGNGE